MRPIEDVLAEIHPNRGNARGPGISHVLSLAHDQLMARSRLRVLAMTARILVIFATIFFVIGLSVLREVGPQMMVVAGVITIGALAYCLPVFLNWETYRAWERENDQILNAAIQAIQELLERGLIPKRL